jgi:hypothetical protein
MCLQKRRVKQINFASGWRHTAWCSRSFLSTATVVLGLVTAGRMYATSIEIDLGSPPKVTSHVSVPFDALDNTALGGQTISIDLAMSNSEFVRLFTVTSSLFNVSITLQTNGTNSHHFSQGTGFLVDSQGMAIPGFGVTGRAAGDDLLTIGLFPLLKDKNGTPNNDLPRPLDFFGVHFDLTFPDTHNPSIHVTGGEFGLFSNPGEKFGLGPGVPHDIVPDSGSTLLLFSVAVFGLLGLRQIRRLT